MLKNATSMEKCKQKLFWNPRTPQIVVCVQCQSSYHVSLTPKKAGQNFMVERQRCTYLLYIFYIPDRCLDHRNFVILSFGWKWTSTKFQVCMLKLPWSVWIAISQNFFDKRVYQHSYCFTWSRKCLTAGCRRSGFQKCLNMQSAFFSK